jgi:anti-sigma factor RsiW
MLRNHPETALIPYLRGELSGDERARVENHLSGCAQCREFAGSSSAIIESVGKMTASIPTPDWNAYNFELRRKLAVRREPRAVWWRPQIAWMTFASAGAAAIALVLFLSMRQPASVGGPPVDQIAMETEMKGADIGLLQNYKMVEHLDLLEDYDVIERLPSTLQQGNEKSS